MRVRAINSGRYLTGGREYIVIDVCDLHYRILDDTGEPYGYPKAEFEVVDRTVPTGWVFRDSADPDDGYYLGPGFGAGAGFYESYFNSDGDVAKHAASRDVWEAYLQDLLVHLSEQDRSLVSIALSRRMTRKS